MVTTTRTLDAKEVLDPALARDWDALTLGRGTQADLYDTHDWLRAWAVASDPAALRVPCVFEGDRLVAALPVVVRPFGRWEAAGMGYRPRFRVLARGAAPSADDLDPLAEELARAGAKQLTLPVMPTRDPATEALAAALGRAGFRCGTVPGTSECLAPVEGGWAGHRSRFKKFERTAKNFFNKGERLGPVVLSSFGAEDQPSVVDAFPVYLDVHARGWKGALGGPMTAYRRALLEATQATGRARVFVLSVAGVAAAAIVWFRVGEVAIAFSTVYDQQFAAISPGTVLMWQSHERIFAEAEPALVDLLPGHGAQKDQLGPEAPGLVTLVAERGRSIASLAAPVAAKARAVGDRVRRSLREARSGPADPGDGRARVVSVAAGPRTKVARGPVTLDPRLEILLAVAGGHASPAAMAATWCEGDEWWRVDGVMLRVGWPGAAPVPRPGPAAAGESSLAASTDSGATPAEPAAAGTGIPRGGGPRVVREVVREVVRTERAAVGAAADSTLDAAPDTTLDAALAAVATALGTELTARLPVPAGRERDPIPVRTTRFAFDA